ncbi:MAG: hypothetical protein FRX49_02722 [Trebouxia sp. A1-2]|nr:MAG: hypothetical protein FRX49_02722 [Trebouxia sp. A1-2]
MVMEATSAPQCCEAAGVARPNPDIVLGDMGVTLSTLLWRMAAAKESKYVANAAVVMARMRAEHTSNVIGR